MKIYSFIAYLCTLTALLFSGYNAYPQNIRQSSYFTYIYQISNNEAKQILENKNIEINPEFFHTLVDTHATDSTYDKRLEAGHYLKVFTVRNRQITEYAFVPDFDVMVLNNNTDLRLQVYDLKGNIIKNADVKVKSRKLNFDEKTQCYIHKKSNKKGLLSVNFNGNTAYYQLNRRYNNSAFKRNANMVLYGTPVKYAWIPINFAVHIPIDAVSSIKHRYTQGTIRVIEKFFAKTWDGFKCLFSENAREDYYDKYDLEHKFDEKHRGYIVFNKPKYMPGDTVKFKAFIAKKNGKPVDEPVDVVVENRKEYVLTSLKPYRKGFYEYQFTLHDSLNLKLDREYSLYLKKHTNNDYYNYKYIGDYFKYEDYELSKINIDIKSQNNVQYSKMPFSVSVKATDENNLNLMDARIKILAKTTRQNKFFDSYTFVPDTLFYIEKELNPYGETEIEFADSLFPKANLEYFATFNVLTSDNRNKSTSKNFRYLFLDNDFDISLQNDSIEFAYCENGIRKQKNVKILAVDNFYNTTEIMSVQTPCKIKLQPYYYAYIAQTDSLSKRINIEEQNSLLQCFSRRTGDSVFFEIQNPRKLNFSYNIYKANKEIERGSGTSLNYKQPERSTQNYFVALTYLWGGEIKEATYKIPFNDRKLNISVKQPRLIIPGQKTETEILVTDQKGNPVEGADLTAFALTNKFGYSAPDVPQFYRKQKNKHFINSFSIDAKSEKEFENILDYKYWNTLSQLDSIEYYKFLYPGNKIYKNTFPTDDSVTQFAPFAVSAEGQILPVHVIYVDNRPLYFSFTTAPQPYSFRIKPGKHNVSLRLLDKTVKIDSVHFEAGKKTVLSFRSDIYVDGIKIYDAKPMLSKNEQNVLHRYIFPYRKLFGDTIVYLQSQFDDNILLLNDYRSYGHFQNYAAPINGNLTFTKMSGYTTNFRHEPFFEYDFAPNLLKMRQINRKQYPVDLSRYNYKIQSNIFDKALTVKMLNEKWKNFLSSKHYNALKYSNPTKTASGFGTLQIDISHENYKNQSPILFTLLFSNDSSEFMRTFKNEKVFYNLEEGNYRLLFIFSDKNSFAVDSIGVKANGINYQKVIIPAKLNNNELRINTDSISLDTVDIYTQKAVESISAFTIAYTGSGRTVSGYVSDNSDKSPIPYANVFVEGTSYGTYTDENGFYSINVPFDKNILIFSFIGYKTKEIDLNVFTGENVNLEADFSQLEESVVVAYGSVQKRFLTGSVAHIDGYISEALQGTIPGVQAIPGAGGNITIRGSASVEADSQPLYIIDGIVYTGNDFDLSSDEIAGVEMLKDQSFTSIYGSRAANGVVIVTTKKGSAARLATTLQTSGKKADFDDDFLDLASQSSSIRSNFSDYAYWQPKLTTDKSGKAIFSAVFPDDVTNWDAFVLAANDKKQSGQVKSNIRSFKPLMAQLAVPRFLVAGDTANVIGKTLNYTADTVQIKSSFDIDGKNVLQQQNACANVLIDTLQLVAPADSFKVRYTITKTDGYFDGEEREIPVFPQGLEETEGEFMIMDSDTVFSKTFDANAGMVYLYAKSNLMDVMLAEIDNVANYKYSCNEQLASKLKVLLAKRKIALHTQQAWNEDNLIQKMVKTLLARKNNYGLWGWWQNAGTNYNFSLHILTALIEAQQQTFSSKESIKINTEQIAKAAILKLDVASNAEKIDILRLLKSINARIDYETYLQSIEKDSTLNFNSFLKFTELKQLNGTTINIDTLKHFYHETVFGNAYYSNDSEKPRTRYDLENNRTQNTLLAYKILRRNNSERHAQLLRKIRLYLLESKSLHGWRNTYETSNVVETLLPDILALKQAGSSKLIISGDISKTMQTSSPLAASFKPDNGITIAKSGSEPVYFTVYQRKWNNSPNEKHGELTVSTHFENNNNMLEAGKPVKLVVNLNVKNDADYVMINVPIPAGCSYAGKPQGLKYEVRREYFRNETAIFCQKLNAGNYTFGIELMPRFGGTYSLNPAKAELMYFPTFNANNEIKHVEIR